MASSKLRLKNKPLIEAIFELRWFLQQKGVDPSIRVDPNYNILLGRLYDRIIKKYPHHEKLPASNMPNEIVGYIVQHRFRVAADTWPLIQIGPGVITLNDTKNYTWEDFFKRVSDLLKNLINSYPVRKELKLNMLHLRYIDGIEFNFDEDNIFQFLEDKMKTKIEFHSELFKGTGVKHLPAGFSLDYSFFSNKPKGTIALKFRRGKLEKKDALIWETVLEAHNENIPKTEKGIKNWLNSAHSLTSDWFFKTIEGELFERFK